MQLVNKYQLSYTAASLRMQDTIQVIKAHLSNDFDGVDARIGNGKTSTGKRIRLEIQSRIENLNQKQLEFIINSNMDNAKKMVFVAICKTYQFIYEFVVEVVREKFHHLDFEITDGDYYSFLNRKMDIHPELEQISDSSLYKIRQVLFRIFEEAGMIDNTKNKHIQPQFITDDVAKLIVEDDSALLRVFLLTDQDIKNYNERFN